MKVPILPFDVEPDGSGLIDVTDFSDWLYRWWLLIANEYRRLGGYSPLPTGRGKVTSWNQPGGWYIVPDVHFFIVSEADTDRRRWDVISEFPVLFDRAGPTMVGAIVMHPSRSEQSVALVTNWLDVSRNLDLFKRPSIAFFDVPIRQDTGLDSSQSLAADVGYVDIATTLKESDTKPYGWITPSGGGVFERFSEDEGGSPRYWAATGNPGDRASGEVPVTPDQGYVPDYVTAPLTIEGISSQFAAPTLTCTLFESKAYLSLGNQTFTRGLCSNFVRTDIMSTRRVIGPADGYTPQVQAPVDLVARAASARVSRFGSNFSAMQLVDNYKIGGFVASSFRRPNFNIFDLADIEVVSGSTSFTLFYRPNFLVHGQTGLRYVSAPAKNNDSLESIFGLMMRALNPALAPGRTYADVDGR